MVRPPICMVCAFLIVSVLLSHVETLAFDRHKLTVSISGDRSNCNIIKDYEARIITPYLPSINNSRHKPHPGIYGLTGRIAYRISKSVSLNGLLFYSQKTTLFRNLDYFIPESGDHILRTFGGSNTDSRLSGSGLGLSIQPKIYKIRPVLSAELLICQVNTSVKFKIIYIEGVQNFRTVKIDDEIKDWGCLGTFSLGIPFNLSVKYSLTPFIGYRYSDKINIKNEDYGIITKFKLDYSSLWSGLNINYRIQ